MRSKSKSGGLRSEGIRSEGLRAGGPELSIIVPAYNESRRMRQFAESLLRFAPNLDKICSGHEIIFVDDGSSDNTYGLMKELCIGRKDCRIISYRINKGKGGAVREGVLAARGQKIIFIDADGSIAPELIADMAQMLKSHDAVVGTRYKKGARKKQPLIRRFTAFLFNLYTRCLFGLKVSDMLCGFKGFRKETAKRVFTPLISKRWIFDVEIFFRLKAMKARLFELPIRWEHRAGSRIKIKDMLKMAFELLTLRIKLC